MKIFPNPSLLNINFVRNKWCRLKDFVMNNLIYIFFMCTTRLHNDNSAIICALTTETHVLHYTLHPGRGVVASLTNHYNLKNRVQKFCVSQLYGSSIINWEKNIILKVIYSSSHVHFSLFLHGIGSFLLHNKIHKANEIYLRDFNLQIDDVTNYDAQKFLRLVNKFSLVYLANKSTYKSGHTLDLVFAKKSSLRCEKTCWYKCKLCIRT